MIQRLLNRLSLSRILSILVLSLLLPSTAWADYTYGGQSLTFYYSGESGPNYYYSGSESNQVTEWNVTTTGDYATYEASTYKYSGFEDLRLTYVKSFKGTINDFTLSGTISSDNNVDVKVYRLASLSASERTLIGSITIGSTLTYVAENGVSQSFNNEYIQLAFEQNNGVTQSNIYTNNINSITLTFSGIPLWIGGTQVTDGNANDVLGDSKVSFTPANDAVSPATPATLTLNGATITGQIISSYDVLTVHLLGENTITPGDGNAPFVYNGTNTGTLTFDTEWVSDENGMCSLGSLTINGITQTQGSVTNGYTISNTFENNFPGYIDPEEADELTTGWKKTYDDNYIQIWKFEAFDLWIGSGRVISTALEAGQSGGFRYNPLAQALIAQGVTGYPIQSKLEELVIAVDGNASLIHSYEGTSAITYTGEGNGKLTFVKAEDADMASLTLGVGSNDKAISGFRVQDITIEEPMILTTPASMENILDATTVTIANYSESYDISIAGTTVTDGNAEDVLGDGKVNYNKNTHTLTLNGATIILEGGEVPGIVYTGDADLTITLKGTNNTVKVTNGCPAITYYGQLDTPPSLTFTKGDTQACSLLLESQDESVIDAFTEISHEGLFMLSETVFGADQNNIYRTTISSTLLGGGSGTEEDPFLIKTKENLATFAQYVNNGTITTEYVKLNPEGGELDCDGLTGFEPIGFLINSSNNHPFIGKFDGNNCTIKNLTYSTTGTGDRVGLFGYVGREDVSDTKIEKLTLSNCSFNGGEYAGGIVGELKNGTIENCVLSSCTVKSGNAQIPYAGGIAGQVYNGKINKCTFNSGLVDCTTAYSSEPSGGVYAGGIVGNIYSTNSVTVSSCIVSSTNVKSVHSGNDGAYDIYVGGIVGCSLGTVAISGNSVTTTDNTKKISCQNLSEMATNYHCGVIIGDKGDATTLTNNTYEYDVTTEIAGTTKTGYTHRGVGGNVDNPDIIENKGAVLYTKPVVLPAESPAGTIMGKEGTYYSTVVENDVLSILVAPHQTATIIATPGDTYYTPVWLKAVNGETTIATDSTYTDGVKTYTFEMPDAEVTVTAKFAIDLSAEGITATIANATYTGEAIEPTTIAVEGIPDVTSLTNGTDFTITGYTKGGETVTSPIDAGTYTISIEGKGNYTGTKNVSYTIEKGNAGLYFYHIVNGEEDQVLAVEETTYGTAYNAPLLKNPHNLSITFRCTADNTNNGEVSDVATIDSEGNLTILKEGTVYVYAITSGNDNYEGTDVHYQLNVEKGNLSSVTIAAIDDQTYTGSAIEPAVTVTLNGEEVSTDDYTVSYSYNTNVSTDTQKATITLTAKSTSTRFAENTTKTVTFSIIAKSLSEATITLSETEYTYDGNAKNPSVSITFESEGADGTSGTTTLTEGTDYDVTYKKVVGESEEGIAANEIISAATYKAIATAKGNYTGSKEATFAIAKANITPTITLEGWTYGDNANNPSVSGNTGNGSVTYEYKLQNEADSKYKADVPTEAGDYTIKATIAATANYEAAVDSTHFTITKANITPRVAINGWAYGATANTPTISDNTGNGSVTYEYKLQNEADSKYKADVPTEAGDYTIKATIAATANYEAAVDSTHFTITKANITPRVAINGWAYGATANTPTISDNTGNGSVTYEYKLQNEADSKYKADVPTEAGDYTIKATIAATANYESAVDSTHFTISKANITPRVAINGWAYGATANTPTVSGNTGNGSVTYEYKLQNEADSKYKADVPTEAGDYTIKATIAATANYEAAVDSTHFTISKANITPKVTLEGWTYGDNANNPSVSGNTGNGSITYEYKLQNEDDSKYGTELPTEAGNYTIKATIAATANYEAAVDSTHFTIAKANITPRITLEGWTYGDAANDPSVSGNTGNGNVTYEYKLQNEADSKYKANVPTEAGDYTIKATIAATANYEAAVDSTHFAITKANITPRVAINGWAYGATANTPTVSGNTGNGSVTYEYKLQNEADSKYKADVPTEAGDYTIKATIAATANYESAVDSTHFTISKATPSIIFDEENYSATYGEAFTAPTPTTSPEGLTVVVTSSSNTQVATIANGVISIIGVGETTITVSFAGNDNYNATTATYKLTVGAASMEIVGTGYSGIYDGQAHGITVNAPQDAVIKYGTTEGTYNLETSPEYTDAGNYTVYYQVTRTNYQTVTGSKTVVIAKADVSITYNEDGYTTTYGEEFNPPTPTTNPTGLTLTPTSSSNTQVATVTDGRINITGVGETNITVSFAGNNNYNDTTVTYRLTVGAASMEIVGTGYSGIYDGQAHGIIVTAPEEATIKYGTTEGTYNLNASPEYTDAGSYTVYYQVTQENYQTVTGSKTIVIAKADVSITYNEDGYTATYGEEFNPPTPSTNPEELPLTATSSSDTQVATVTDGRINITGVGETNITVSFAGNNNYNDTTVTYKLTVEAASMSVTAEGFSGVYDSEAHGITITAPEVATIKYGTTEGTYNLDASPEYTDAGNYTVYYQVTQENYQTVTGSKTVIISKADINPTIALEGWTYGATANTPEVNGNTGNGTETITYKAEGAEEFSSEVPSEVGTYIVKVTIAETTNYNGGEATSTFTITNRTIDPAEDIEFSDGQSYASFYSANEDLALPEEGIAVFMITGLDGNTLTTQAVTYIPKGVPVLVMKSSGATQAIDPSEVSNNMLHYATSDVTADGTTYILYNGEYVRATGTIPAGKCYLKLNKPSGARALAIGNGTTGIDRLDNTEWATDNWFDLNGRRIEKPTKKGLYIKNGKKVVVK